MTAARPFLVRPAAPIPPRRRLGGFARLRALRNNPIEAFAEPAYRARILEIGLFRKMLLVNDPDEIEHILVGRPDAYCKSIQQRRHLRPALGDGLLTAEGETWRHTRRIAAPAFSPRAVAALFGDMRLAAEAMRQRWLVRGTGTQVVDVADEFQRLTYEIVSQCLFSGGLDAERIAIHASMSLYFETLGRLDLATVLRLPGWVSAMGKRPARSAVVVFRSVAESIVEGRRRRPPAAVEDFLERLMAGHASGRDMPLPPGAVADNVLTFLAAGHETTGNALSWIIYLLALHPSIAGDVVDEMRVVLGDAPPERADLERLVLTRAVVREALRLYPPAPFIGREAICEDVVAGRQVGPGTQILIAPWIVHRHREIWDEPDAFRPARFLTDKTGGVPRGAYIPFGLGPRTCIGEGFAVQEIMTVLATLLPAFTWRLDDPQAVFPQARITLRARSGIRVALSPITVKAPGTENDPARLG